MRSPAKRWASGVTLLVVLIAVYWYVTEQREQHIRQAMRAKAQALKEAVDRRFPVGSSAEAVSEFLDRQPAAWRALSSGRDYWLSIGKAPSGMWHCGPIDYGIIAVFKDGRLQSTRVDSMALNCL